MYMQILELIETLWNVNRRIFICPIMVQSELIETLWNVNETENKNHNERNEGINRNIVECKLPTAARQYIATPELIETLWNVNE